MRLQCTECYIEGPSMDVFKNNGCIDKHHDIIKILTEQESSQILESGQENNFQVKRNDSNVTKIILDHKIRMLRPQTLLNSGTRMILVYLPTKEIVAKGNGDRITTSHTFTNSAYFVVSRPKNTLGSEREILPFDDASLTEKFKIDVLQAWNDVRWEISDLKSWLKESILSDPVQLYRILYDVTRKYIEFENEAEYVKFVLWNIGTYCFELFDAYPYNDYTGTKRAGKSKCLEFQKLVCYNAVMSPDITSSATFRIIEGLGATMLFDETEQFKNPRNDQAQQVRTLLLQGFLKNQFAVRSEGKERGGFTPVPYNLYSPKSLAHINAFDDVLEDRCIQQINKRAIDSKIKNTWPTDKDQTFQKIRNLCYRLFLDYADQISELQDEARNILSVSGRELQLWTPVITLALFFENHGVSGLIEAIKNSVNQSSQDRRLLDEQESKDLRILSFLADKGIQLAQNKDIIKNNPAGWIPVSELYGHFKTQAHDYEINTEYFTRNTLTQTLKRLGFKQAKKEGGISWLITHDAVMEVKTRQELEPAPDTLKITSFTSESSAAADLGTNQAESAEVLESRGKNETSANRPDSEPKLGQTEDSEHSEGVSSQADLAIGVKPEVLNSAEVLETSDAMETSGREMYRCSCGALFRDTDKGNLGMIKDFHEKQGHTVKTEESENYGA